MSNPKNKNKGFTPLEKIMNKTKRKKIFFAKSSITPASFDKKKSLTGFTLIEVIAASAIFLIVLLLAAEIFILGWRATRWAGPETEQLRTARKAMEAIRVNIMTSERMYGINTDTDIIITANGFEEGGTIKREATGFRVARNAENLLYDLYKVTYPSDYNPLSIPAPEPVSSVFLAGRIKNCKITTSEYLYSIDISVASADEKQPDIRLMTSTTRTLWRP